jgi:transposase
MARLCRDVLDQDPFSGAVYVFRSRSGKSLRLLVYDGQGFWLCHKRLSAGRFRSWPTEPGCAALTLLSHQLHVLLYGGDPRTAKGAAIWRPVCTT